MKPSEAATRLGRLRDEHPFAGDLAVTGATAGLSIAGLASQHRLDTTTLAFCAAICSPLLLRRASRTVCFGTIAVVALAQWLRSGHGVQAPHGEAHATPGARPELATDSV